MHSNEEMAVRTNPRVEGHTSRGPQPGLQVTRIQTLDENADQIARLARQIEERLVMTIERIDGSRAVPGRDPAMVDCQPDAPGAFGAMQAKQFDAQATLERIGVCMGELEQLL